MKDDILKIKLKEIYDFVEQNQIKCFYCAGYDYDPKTTLEDLIDMDFDESPNMIIHLNTHSQNYLQEMKVIKKRFPNYYFVHSDYSTKNLQ
jgi:hypothetical protein